MNTDNKIKILYALVEIKLALSNYADYMGDNTHSEIHLKQLKSAFENIDVITKVIRESK